MLSLEAEGNKNPLPFSFSNIHRAVSGIFLNVPQDIDGCTFFRVMINLNHFKTIIYKFLTFEIILDKHFCHGPSVCFLNS